MIGQLFIGLAMATHQWQAYNDKQHGKWWYLMDEQGNEWWCDNIVGTPVERVCSRPGDWPAQPAGQPRRAKRSQDPEIPGTGSKSTNAPKRLKQDEDNNTAGTTPKSSGFQATHLSQGPPIPQGASES